MRKCNMLHVSLLCAFSATASAEEWPVPEDEMDELCEEVARTVVREPEDPLNPISLLDKQYYAMKLKGPDREKILAEYKENKQKYDEWEANIESCVQWDENWVGPFGESQKNR